MPAPCTRSPPGAAARPQLARKVRSSGHISCRASIMEEAIRQTRYSLPMQHMPTRAARWRQQPYCAHMDSGEACCPQHALAAAPTRTALATRTNLQQRRPKRNVCAADDEELLPGARQPRCRAGAAVPPRSLRAPLHSPRDAAPVLSAAAARLITKQNDYRPGGGWLRKRAQFSGKAHSARPTVADHHPTHPAAAGP